MRTECEEELTTRFTTVGQLAVGRRGPAASAAAANQQSPLLRRAGTLPRTHQDLAATLIGGLAAPDGDETSNDCVVIPSGWFVRAVHGISSTDLREDDTAGSYASFHTCVSEATAGAGAAASEQSDQNAVRGGYCSPLVDPHDVESCCRRATFRAAALDDVALCINGTPIGSAEVFAVRLVEATADLAAAGGRDDGTDFDDVGEASSLSSGGGDPVAATVGLRAAVWALATPAAWAVLEAVAAAHSPPQQQNSEQSGNVAASATSVRRRLEVAVVPPQPGRSATPFVVVEASATSRDPVTGATVCASLSLSRRVTEGPDGDQRTAAVAGDRGGSARHTIAWARNATARVARTWAARAAAVTGFGASVADANHDDDDDAAGDDVLLTVEATRA